MVLRFMFVAPAISYCLCFVFLRMSGRKNGKQLSDVFQKLRANHNKKDQGSKKRPDPTSETSKVRKKNEIFERV